MVHKTELHSCYSVGRLNIIFVLCILYEKPLLLMENISSKRDVVVAISGN